jgi:hypothetical protein
VSLDTDQPKPTAVEYFPMERAKKDTLLIIFDRKPQTKGHGTINSEIAIIALPEAGI